MAVLTPAGDVLDKTAEKAGAGTAPHPSNDAEARQGFGDDVRLPPQTDAQDVSQDAPAKRGGFARFGDWLQRALQFFTAQGSSSLTRRIVVLNVAGLLALSIGISYLSQFRAGLIDARVQSLLVQSRLSPALSPPPRPAIPFRSPSISTLLTLQPGQSYSPSEDALTVRSIIGLILRRYDLNQDTPHLRPRWCLATAVTVRPR